MILFPSLRFFQTTPSRPLNQCLNTLSTDDASGGLFPPRPSFTAALRQVPFPVASLRTVLGSSPAFLVLRLSRPLGTSRYPQSVSFTPLLSESPILFKRQHEITLMNTLPSKYRTSAPRILPRLCPQPTPMAPLPFHIKQIPATQHTTPLVLLLPPCDDMKKLLHTIVSQTRTMPGRSSSSCGAVSSSFRTRSRNWKS